MAQDEMSPKFVTKLERFFEVDGGAFLPIPEGGAGQSFVGRLHRESSRLHRNDGEAHTRASDRGPDRDRCGIKGRGDSQIEKFAPARPLHPPHIGDYSGKHASKLRAYPAVY